MYKNASFNILLNSCFLIRFTHYPDYICEDIAEPYMHIYTKLPDGTTITHEVQATHTIDTVKALIHDRKAIPASHQHIIFGDDELDNDDATLTYYNIFNGA